MRNGLRLFGAFTELILESRVGTDRNKEFIKQYALATGKNCKADVITRTDKSAWAYSLDTKIYFDAPGWVIESLHKLGIHIVKGILCSLKNKYADKGYENISKCKYSISNNDFFWWLVEYGYRLGENKAIPYESYRMNCALKVMETKRFTIIPMIHIEAEDPIVEAKMFAEMAQ